MLYNLSAFDTAIVTGLQHALGLTREVPSLEVRRNLTAQGINHSIDVRAVVITAIELLGAVVRVLEIDVHEIGLALVGGKVHLMPPLEKSLGKEKSIGDLRGSGCQRCNPSRQRR